MRAALLWDGPPLPEHREAAGGGREKERAVAIVILGIDLGKNVCSLVGVDEDGAVVLRRRMRRQTVLTFAAKLPSCVVAMEACCGAHHLGRLLTAQGHTVKLM